MALFKSVLNPGSPVERTDGLAVNIRLRKLCSSATSIFSSFRWGRACRHLSSGSLPHRDEIVSFLHACFSLLFLIVPESKSSKSSLIADCTRSGKSSEYWERYL